MDQDGSSSSSSAGFDPDGKPWPARLARAAAYNPATNTWRRIAPLPKPRSSAYVVWDGHEVLVAGGCGHLGAGREPSDARPGRLRLHPGHQPLAPAAADGVRPHQRHRRAWSGEQLLLWGGQTAVDPRGGNRAAVPPHGLAYNPGKEPLVAAPAGAGPMGRVSPTAVWTGRELIVWGGYRPDLAWAHRGLADGAAFRPATR